MCFSVLLYYDSSNLIGFTQPSIDLDKAFVNIDNRFLSSGYMVNWFYLI